MATARFAWGIDVGNRALKAVKLVREGDGMRIDDFEVIEHETVLSNAGDNKESLIQTALYASEILIARNIGLTIGSDRRNRHNCKGLEIGWNDVRAVYLYQDHLFWGAKNTVSGKVHLDATVLSQDGIIN